MTCKGSRLSSEWIRYWSGGPHGPPRDGEDEITNRVPGTAAPVAGVKTFPSLHGHRLGGHLVEGGKACSLKEVPDVDVIPPLTSNDAPGGVIYGDLHSPVCGIWPLALTIESRNCHSCGSIRNLANHQSLGQLP
eukprot:TRINITY_DN2263_c0_g1_i2.p1 TRINITY_DN2263_c0_g1~~TRINITY_DN2263_c0_g1_i2.p1  ORF type:complete len:134 (-),score=22.45 TRINITY_DN2263_c0_g1_i2:365-766(-)